MSKFTIAAQDSAKANMLNLFVGATTGRYQVMEGLKPTTHFLKVEVNRNTAEVKNLSAATVETTGYGVWGHGFHDTGMMYNFKDRELDAQIVTFGMGSAPFSNTYTAEMSAITSTPEFRKSLFTEVVWRVRTLVDSGLGNHSAGFKGAALDIPTYRGRQIFISSVVIGRTFGLSSMRMRQGILGRFNHRVGKYNGSRKPWVGMVGEGETLQAEKVAAWQAHNSRPDVLNKFEISNESVDALANAVHRRIEVQPIRTLDTLNI
tara:strand:+ start:275 stop:1060 length:786 start_codon:yes stop_codon:yes gene_type:complete